VKELNLRFDGDHMVASGSIDQIDERRQQRRLPASAAAGDEHQAFRFTAERLHFTRQPQLICGNGTRRHHPEDEAGTAMVAERHAAHTADLRHVDQPVGGRR
jgi:hypothetical protein